MQRAAGVIDGDLPGDGGPSLVARGFAGRNPGDMLVVHAPGEAMTLADDRRATPSGWSLWR